MPLTEPTQSGVALPAGPEADVAAPAAPALPSGTGAPPRARSEFLYFAFRNWKFVFGATIVLAMLAIAIVGPMAGRPPSARVRRADRPAPVLRVLVRYDVVRAGRLLAVRPRPPRRLPRRAPSAAASRGSSASAIGFTAGYRGGWVDDVLNMLTNVVLVIPTLAILIIVAAYLNVQSYTTEAVLIGLTSWPWAARAVRAQTFSLKTREFVDVARLSGRSTRQIISTEIAPNMSSYLLMMFILLFGGAILIGASLDFLGLGPTESISLGLMMNNAFLASALLLGSWWWFLPPGLGIIAIVGGLYVMNVGLDEVFNPKLRAT